MGLTQEQLAEAMGVSVGAVHKWETGMSTPEITLIVKLANFFNTSVDVLLGYEMKDNRVQAVTERLNQYYIHRDYNGLEEAEQALVKYPNSFWVVFTSAYMYMAFGAQSNNRAWLKRALELMENSERLLSQNPDPTINQMTIQGSEGIIYYILGDLEHAVEILNRSNAGGHHNPEIGTLYTLLPNGSEKAAEYLSGALVNIISDLESMIPGYIKLYVGRKDYARADQFLDWAFSVTDGLRENDTLNALDKIKAAFLICRSYIQIQCNKEAEAKKTFKKAVNLAKEFDGNPDYDFNHLRFIEMSREVIACDILGETAMDAIKTMVGIMDNVELTNMWEEFANDQRATGG